MNALRLRAVVLGAAQLLGFGVVLWLLWTLALPTGALAALAVLAALALAAGGGWLQGLFLERPLEDVRELAADLGRSPREPLPPPRTKEAGEVRLALEAARSRWIERLTALEVRGSAARDAAVRAGAVLGELRTRQHASKLSAEALDASAVALDDALEQIRSSLDAIAASTSDNSTSLTEMSTSIDDVASGSEQLALHVSTTASAVIEMIQAIVAVADSVEVLARETETTATAIAQIDASTREIERNAREASDLGGRMAESAREGSDAVQETLGGIHDSYRVIQETARAMEELAEASRAIGSVVKIINEINDKTKLLALNAAIIAAQAGEHGKSFAVVAHEIKSLSDRTAASTGEISRIIGNTRERVSVAMERVGQGERSMGRSVELAERAGQLLVRILSTAEISHEMTRGILRGTEEQAKGARSVMASMHEVSSMVAQIRLAAQEHRGTGESVGQSTEVMRDLTEQVKLATAEQADVGRYIAEAIAAIDRNLQDLVGAISKEREETENILQHTAAFRDQGEAQEATVGELEGLIGEAQRELADLAVAFAAPRGQGG